MHKSKPLLPTSHIPPICCLLYASQLTYLGVTSGFRFSMHFASKSSRAGINPSLFSAKTRTKPELNVWEKSSIFFYIRDYGNKTYMRFYMHLCLKTPAENTAMSKYHLLWLIPAEGVPAHFHAPPSE